MLLKEARKNINLACDDLVVVVVVRSETQAAVSERHTDTMNIVIRGSIVTVARDCCKRPAIPLPVRAYQHRCSCMSLLLSLLLSVVLVFNGVVKLYIKLTSETPVAS